MKKSIIAQHLRAGYPALAIRTLEERRFLEETIPTIGDDKRVVYGSALNRLEDARDGSVIDQKAPAAKCFAYAAENPCVLFYADFRHTINTPVNIRLFHEYAPAWKAIGSTVVFLGADWSKVPLELKHDLPVLHHDLPDESGIRASLATITAAMGKDLPSDVVERLVRDGRGLTAEEAENAFALAAVSGNGGICLDTVAREKSRMIEEQGMLKMLDPLALDQVGGLDPLKAYATRQIANNIGDPLRRVKGVGMVGVPGCGKTTFAQVLSDVLGVPALEADLSACKSGLQGSSQANLRDLLSTVTAFGDCVLVFDEIEKAVAGSASSAQTDGGTGLEMVGILLKWLDRNDSATVVFTCNDFEALPDPLTRSGRIDKWFFVDLPSELERVAIARIHFAKFGCTDIDLMAEAGALAKNFSGAEIEQLAKEAARLQTGKKITLANVKEAHQAIKPAAVTQKESLARLREYALTRFSPANSPDAPVKKTGRKLS